MWVTTLVVRQKRRSPAVMQAETQTVMQIEAQAIDTDYDGVIDQNDLCPKSVMGARVDAHGCEVVDLSLTGVQFRTDSAVLTKQSRNILDNAAAALIYASHVRVEVQAHTDSLGESAHNDDLSARRALAVRDYLANKGVSLDRMEPRGYGESQPIATNQTRAGRQLNRRVELIIIE